MDAAPVLVSEALPLAPPSDSFSGKKVIMAAPRQVKKAERALLRTQTALAVTGLPNSRSTGTASAIKYASRLAWMNGWMAEVVLALRGVVPTMAVSTMTSCVGLLLFRGKVFTMSQCAVAALIQRFPVFMLILTSHSYL